MNINHAIFRSEPIMIIPDIKNKNCGIIKIML